jgi:DNA polymerase-3 subunit alpha
MPALAITDHGAMYGVIDFYDAASTAGIKPILGCEVYVAPRSLEHREPKVDANPYHLILLAENTTGYENLIKLTTEAHMRGFYYKPRVDKDLLARHSAGLIALTGCLAGEIPRKLVDGNVQGAADALAELIEIFGEDHVYAELQDHPRIAEQRVADEQLADLARRRHIPLVATNDSHYVRADDASAHDILLCIQTGKALEDRNRPRLHGDDFSLRPPQEMARAFAAYPDAIANTLEIAERCNVAFSFDRVHLPDYQIPEGFETDSYLHHLCREGLSQRCGAIAPHVEQRLRSEIDVISQLGYSRYFLIVSDIVGFARQNGIMTTCRGSAPGSIVTFALGITPIDPIRYGIPFERFLHTDRQTMPDIDVDFMDTRRDEVIEYITRRYGLDRVAQIITFGTLLARNAVRDVGRTLGCSYAMVDRIAKMIPQGRSLSAALEEVPELREAHARDPETRKLIECAQRIEGLSRHASTHAAGIVISQDPLDTIVPLQKSTRGLGAMTQFHMDNIASLGLLKFDILGLANLSILDAAIKMVERNRGLHIDIENVPLDDAPTYDLLASGETTGVFQFESAGMRRYLKELRPTTIEDLMAMVALFRPGPMANIPAYIRRKHGLEPIRCLHPILEEVLKPTYGVMVYQEDVMIVAQAMADYSLAEADILCSTIRKKKKDLLKKQRQRFARGAKKKGISDQIVSQVFDLFEPFARYGFCKGHAACYGRLAYQTAYMKANYAPEYMAAVLSSEIDNADKLAQGVAECRRMAIDILPPDVNESETRFNVPPGTGQIRFGLAAIKNVGEGAAAGIVAARADGGRFLAPLDFCRRIDSTTLSRDALECMIKVGAFDSLGVRRSQLIAALDTLLALGARMRRDREQGQVTLFGAADDSDEAVDLALPDIAEYAREEIIEFERQLLGVPITHDPAAELEARLRGRVTAFSVELEGLPEREPVVVGGAVRRFRRFDTRRGPMMFVTLEDSRGQMELIVFSDVVSRCGEFVKSDQILIARGRISHKDRQGSGDDVRTEAKVVCDELTPLAAVVGNGANGRGRLHIRINGNGEGSFLERLAGVLSLYRGDAQVILHFPASSRSRKVALGDSHRVDAQNPGLIQKIEELLGLNSVWID